MRRQALRRSPAKKGKTYERPGLSEEEIEEIREAFNLFDTDGSGGCGAGLGGRGVGATLL